MYLYRIIIILTQTHILMSLTTPILPTRRTTSKTLHKLIKLKLMLSLQINIIILHLRKLILRIILHLLQFTQYRILFFQHFIKILNISNRELISILQDIMSKMFSLDKFILLEIDNFYFIFVLIYLFSFTNYLFFVILYLFL